MGAPADLTEGLRKRLSRPGAVTGYAQELSMLGIGREGGVAESAGESIEVVGVMSGQGAGLVPGVYCSLRTARELVPELRNRPSSTAYLIACCRNPADRDESLRMVRSWSEGSESVPPRLGRIQHEWLRVADVFHCYCDLIDGQHQERRGAPSIRRLHW